MSDNLCQLFDDYLDGELTSVERSAFRGHLEVCAACRQAVELQAGLDKAVQDFAETIVPQYRGIDVSVVPEAKSTGQTATARSVVVAVAALVLVTIGVSLSMRVDRPDPLVVHHDEPTPQASADKDDVNIHVPPPVERPYVRSVNAPGFLAVVEPDHDDGLTFVMLYEKLQPLNQE